MGLREILRELYWTLADAWLCAQVRLHLRAWRWHCIADRVPTWRAIGYGLPATLADAWRCADLSGHLVAWWEVATGKVEVE